MLSDNDEIPNLNSEQFKKSKNKIILFKQLFFIISLTSFTIRCRGLEQKDVKKRIYCLYLG